MFKLLALPPKGKKCEGMAGLPDESKTMIEHGAEPGVLDAAFIATAQKVEREEEASR